MLVDHSTSSIDGTTRPAQKQFNRWLDMKDRIIANENCAPEQKGYDKTSLEIFGLKDKSLTDLDNLPEPNDLAEGIIENLEASLSWTRYSVHKKKRGLC